MLLIGLAIVLFLLEFTVTSHGLLTVGGIVCFALGASALYTAPGDADRPGRSRSIRPIIATLTGLTGGYMAFILFVVVRWRRASERARSASSTGPVLSAGALGEVRTGLLPLGVVYAAGRGMDRPDRGRHAAPGAARPCASCGRDGLTLIVEPIDQPARAG